MKVIVTEPAEDSLKEIYCNFEKPVAMKIVRAILDKADTLQTFSARGRIVEELRFLNQNHRYIIEGNFKIIYRQENDFVYVTDVFNMSKDVKKIKY